MASGFSYDFDVPSVQKIFDDEDMDVDHFSTPFAKSPRTTRSSAKKPLPDVLPRLSDKQRRSKSAQKTKSPMVERPVRQSPRLASIAKALLPNMPKVKSSPGRLKQHRRSLSETDVAQIKSKVQKHVRKPSCRPVVARGGLTESDRSALEEIANFSQTLRQTTAASKRLNTSVCSDGSAGPTKPKPFSFQTDKRLRDKSTSNQDLENVKEFAKMLRSNDNLAADTKPRGPTKPVPFKFHQPSKPSTAELSSQPFLSMAELNMKYYTATPKRFRVSADKECRNRSKPNNGLTQPQTPALSTRSRTRGTVNYLTAEEREMEEFKEEQKNKFRAQPLDRKIFEIPKEQQIERKKTATAFEPFDIVDSKRSMMKDSVSTQYKSARRLLAQCGNLIPHSGVPNIWKNKRTELKPFSFDQRDKAKNIKKKENIEKVIQEEKKLAEFTAQPMPIFEAGVSGLPPKKTPSKTTPQPFNFKIDQRGEMKQTDIRAIIAAREEELANLRKFKAQSDIVVHKQPFVPEKSHKPLTDISGFTLNTELRKEKRAEYELYLKQKEDELTLAKQELEDRRKKEEQEEIAKMRKTAVHKAKPVPNYKVPEIKQGILPLTKPISPEFATKTRLRSGRSTPTVDDSQEI